MEFLSKKLFLIFLCWIWIIDVSQQQYENFRKFEQAELVEICLQVTYPTDFCILCIHFSFWEKVKIFDFLKTNG